MHRTQLLLENWQYEALKIRARREGKTLSECVRGALRTLLAPPSTSTKAKSRKELWSICGMGRDHRGPSGRDHDAVLYSKP